VSQIWDILAKLIFGRLSVLNAEVLESETRHIIKAVSEPWNKEVL